MEKQKLRWRQFHVTPAANLGLGFRVWGSKGLRVLECSGSGVQDFKLEGLGVLGF